MFRSFAGFEQPTPALSEKVTLAPGAPDGYRGILFASDGSPCARNAGPLARRIAAQWQLSGSIVSVLPAVLPPYRADTNGSPDDSERTESDCVPAPLEAFDCREDSAGEWAHTVAVGHPGTEIVRAADLQQAQMIVLGLRPHAVLDRLFRDETALAVMQRSHVPVLGVASKAHALPNTVLVGMDFSRASIAALNAAAAIVQPGGTLLLAHVISQSLTTRRSPTRLSTRYNNSVADSLIRLQLHIQNNWGLAAETVLLNGAVVPELRALLQARNIDLLAVGKTSDHPTSISLGSVPTALTRVADCSLLVAPGDVWRYSRQH